MRKNQNTSEDETNSNPIKKPPTQENTSKKVLIGVIATVICIILLVGALFHYKSAQDKENVKKAAIKASTEKKRIIEKRRQQRWDDAVRFAKIKPMEDEASFQRIIVKFKQIAKVYKGTKYVKKAEQEIARLENLKEKKKKDSIENLKKEAAPYIKKGDFTSAFTIYRNYPSDFQDQTLKERKRLIDELTNIQLIASTKKAEAKRTAKIKATVHAKKIEKMIFNRIASFIIKSKYSDAKNQLEKYSAKTKHPQMLKVLTELVALDANILKYFKDNIGKKVTLVIKGKKTGVQIKKIDGNIIQGFDTTGKVSTGFKFNLNDVSAKGKIKLVTDKKTPATSIYVGVSAIQKKKYNAAKKYFEKAGPLSEILLTKLKQIQ